MGITALPAKRYSVFEWDAGKTKVWADVISILTVMIRGACGPGVGFKTRAERAIFGFECVYNDR